MLKLSRAAGNQRINLPNATLPANEDWTIGVIFAATGYPWSTGSQALISTGIPGVAGALNLSYDNGRLAIRAGTNAGVATSYPLINTGTNFCFVEKVGQKLKLQRIAGVRSEVGDGSSVLAGLGNMTAASPTLTIPVGETISTPNGISLGAVAGLPLTNQLNHTLGRAFAVKGALTNVQMEQIAYGMTPDELGLEVLWSAPLESLASPGKGVVVEGTPEDYPDPAFVYVPPPKKKWGTYENFFNTNSFWNSTPVGLHFDNSFVIPRDYNPISPYNEWPGTVSAGPYSTQVCKVYAEDPPMIVYASNPSVGIKDSDGLQFYPSITINHWNDGVVSATGSDGHCDVYDTTTGILANFWVLKKDVNGRWTAPQVSFIDTTENGYGWPNGGQYSMGARSAGVASSAGSIRNHEVGDGKERYEHALTCSLSSKGLSGAAPGYIAPAGMADKDYYINTGKIPLGALLMLPPGSDAQPTNAEELKLQNSLLPGGKGARVTDRNTNTPIVFYVENGGPVPVITSAFMHRLRPLLRQVTSVDSWLNGDGLPRVPENPNIASLRGPYSKINSSTGPIPTFNSGKQTADYPESTASSSNEQNGSSMSGPAWFKPQDGKRYVLETHGEGDAKVRLTLNRTIAATAIKSAYASPEITSGPLLPGQSFEFTYSAGLWPKFSFSKPAGPAASIGVTIKEVLV